MIDLNYVSANIANTLKDEQLGEFKVGVRTYYPTENARHANFIGNDGAATASITFDVTHPLIETDPDARDYLNSRFSTIAALQPYVKFDITPEPNKWAEEAALFKDVRKLVPNEIPEVLEQWWDTRAKKAAENAKAGMHNYNNYIGHGEHAFQINRSDTEVSARFMVPEGMDADTLEKMIEAKKEQVLDFLGKYIARKRPDLADKTAKLDMVVETQSWGSGYKHVNITFRSKDVLDAMKEPGGLAALPAERHEALKNTNPLMFLKDGDGKTKENPAELQKALARAFFQTMPELTAKIAETNDMVAAISKPLLKLKAAPGTAPEIVEKIDKFLGSDLLKSREEIEASAKKGVFEKQPLQFDKVSSDAAHYKPGLMSVKVYVPKDKFKDVLAALAAPNLSTALDKVVGATPEVTDQGGKVMVGGKEYKPSMIEGFLQTVGLSSPPKSAVDRAAASNKGAGFTPAM